MTGAGGGFSSVSIRLSSPRAKGAAVEGAAVAGAGAGVVDEADGMKNTVLNVTSLFSNCQTAVLRTHAQKNSNLWSQLAFNAESTTVISGQLKRYQEAKAKKLVTVHTN